MSVLLGALRMGRARAEANMSEEIIAGPLIDVEDPDTLEIVRSIDAIYAGPAQIKYPTLTVSERSLPGQQVAVADIIVKLPVSDATLPVNSWIRVTASTVDPSLITTTPRYRVKASPQSGQVTAHRYPVSEDSL